MVGDGEYRDVAGLTVSLAGELRGTGDPWMPFVLADADGGVVAPVAAYLKDVQACGRSEATLRSYGTDLLRWFRFCWASGLEWDQVTRSEAADFCRWLTVAGKPGGGYAPATVAHCETVLRHFYGFHLEAGTGPMVNPFPLARGRGRLGAHHNPMDPFPPGRAGLFRPRLPRRAPRCIPDGQFSELFARLGSHRDRALAAFWVSTGARASELLGATAGDVDPGRQLITVIRKGTRAMQQLPASPDAFVWLRLYQEEVRGLVPAGQDQPLWWTLRRPFRQLTYHAALRMFTRAGESLGTDWTLHALRHTAAYRMARDPEVPLADIQWVLGHARLSTTQLYLTAYPEEAIRGHRAFIAQRRAARPSEEYRTPTDAEWDEFLGHFQRRRVALGDCGRAYSTPCIHEHSCIRCPLLRIDPAQRGRLEEIRDNLRDRITEAEREGWTGEAEGLKVSLDAATSKLAQADLTAARRTEAINLGIPAYRDIAAATLAATGDPYDH